MIALRYLASSLLRRKVETIAAVLALGIAVAFLASLGSFVTQNSARLTTRAAERVPVDWQVQVSPGSDPAAVETALRSVPDLTGYRAVDYVRVTGLRARTATGLRTTGSAFVVGVPRDYKTFAPAEMRALLGPTEGNLLQQQTASNLGAGPGAQVDVLVGTHSQRVAVNGVVDLPAADSLFQAVGSPAGAGAAAPPDNVLLVPIDQVSRLAQGTPVIHQFHVRFSRTTLPTDPAAAANLSTQRANHFAAATAGGALVGDNLGAALSAAREDALYARLLVLLLGVPGVVLAGVVTALVMALRSDRQRRDIGLLRLRGATPARIGGLLGLVAVADGVLGAIAGVGGAVVAQRLALPAGSSLSPGWVTSAALAGIALALLTELAPVARLLRRGSQTITAAAGNPAPRRTPLPLRLGLDAIFLAGSALVFWLTARGGYQVVVVPEGVPVASVNYAALLAPALAWPGLALLLWRVTSAVLSRRPTVPLADPNGRLPDVRRAVVRRRRWLVARGATGLGVAVGVAVATAVFTATYDRQARIDVALTVGSDVAVTLPADTAGPGLETAAARAAAVPGAQHVEKMLHRLVYVGPDLQDLYGVDARTIGRAAPLLDAFTPGTTIRQSLARLAARPDGALVSQETLHDYQLRLGDLVRLRLKDASGTYRTVPFHVAGVITEFATAPRDSFVIANASYVAQTTGSPTVQTLLVSTSKPAAVAAELRRQIPRPATVADTGSAAASVTSASGLAASDLSGLARLGLGFGVLLAIASAILVLVVGVTQRRRSLVMLAVLGATARQRAGFVRTEAAVLGVAGVLGGLVAGGVVAAELVKVLNGIFDPAPEHPVVPVTFLVLLVAGVLLGTASTELVCSRVIGRVDASKLRDL
jgi:putative ABC transport system permease protein